MSWIVLVASGFFEAIWALALGRSQGFTRLGPSIVFVAALVASMAGLAFAMRHLPVATSYAVWTGIGAAVTVTVSMITGAEPASAMRIIFLAMIIGGVIGLRFAV